MDSKNRSSDPIAHLPSASEESSAIAKITRPFLSRTVHRDRLFSLLDQGRAKPLIWLSSPAGSGKTTLAASYLEERGLSCLWYQVDEGDADIATFFYYMGLAAQKASPSDMQPLPVLTPEYVQALAAFSQRFFEALCQRLKSPLFIVLDNYQNVPDDSPLHALIAAGIDALPTGITLLVCSRGGPPPPFARLCANNAMAKIGWEDLRLTFEEFQAVVRSHKHPRMDENLQQQLYSRTQGWVAGLVLILESARRGEPEQQSRGHYLPEEMFDYFACELFRNLDAKTREVLLKSAFLPRMTSQAAKELSGRSDAGQILTGLSRANCFTERRFLAEVIYQFHPLFREYLLHEGETVLARDTRDTLARKAAVLLAADGQAEDAAALLVKTEHWEDLIGLVLGNAQALIMQGRNKTLEEWINRIPKPYFDHSPWLFYWLGYCRLPVNPAEARACFINALRRFEENKDRSGAFLSWAGIVTAINFEWDAFESLDAWIAWMENALRENSGFSSSQIEASVAVGMAIALWSRQPDHADFSHWIDRALTLTRGDYGNPLYIQIRMHAIWFATIKGEGTQVAFFIDELEQSTQNSIVSPFYDIQIKTIKTLACFINQSQADQGLEEVRQGHDMIEKSGLLAVGYQLYVCGVYCAFNKGDLNLAGEFLQRARTGVSETCRNGLAHYYFLTAWRELIAGHVTKAFERAGLALRLTLESGVVVSEFAARFLMSQIFLVKRQYGKALEQLDRAKRINERIGSAILLNRSLLAESDIAFETGNEADGLRFLSQALAIGREKEFISLFCYWRPQALARLYAIALQHGVETAYVKRLIRELQLPPTDLINDSWPYPLKIFTLGRFEIVRDGQPLGFAGKVPKKPLELLKVLIAFGGREVAEERIANALWPDAEGDAAHRSFESALYRLRQLLGVDNAIQLIGGLISINPKFCWVDALALQQVVQELENVWKLEGPCSKAESLLEKSMALYGGHFLAGDGWQPWAVTLRERLRDRLAGVVTIFGRQAEDEGHIEQAIGYYEKGLELDELAEEFYERLMACHHRLGRTAKALSIYQRCRAALQAGIGIKPSPCIEELHALIRNNQT